MDAWLGISRSRERGWATRPRAGCCSELQRNRIGSALVRAGLERLREAGLLGCVLVGDAGFYGQFGFQARAGLTYAGVPDEHVLGVAFGDVEPRGRIVAHEAFQVEPEDA